MKDRLRQADERLGGLDADLFALARSYLTLWAAQSNPPEPDEQRVRQVGEELRKKGIEIIDAYGRKPNFKGGIEHRVPLPTGSVQILWDPPKLWHEQQHALREDNDKLIEELGVISFAYEPFQSGEPMYHDEQIQRVLQTDYRPLGFPKWKQFSMTERWFGPRGNTKYSAQQRRTLLGPDTGWVLRRVSNLDEYQIEAYLMNNGKWLECDVAPLRTERRDWPLYSYLYHFIGGESTAQVGPKVLSEDQARKLADEKNRGWIKVHWKRVGFATLTLLVGVVGVWAGLK